MERQIGDNPPLRLADEMTDPYDCRFEIWDSQSEVGSVHYTLTWDGDATHEAESVVVDVIVDRHATHVELGQESVALSWKGGAVTLDGHLELSLTVAGSMARSSPSSEPISRRAPRRPFPRSARAPRASSP